MCDPAFHIQLASKLRFGHVNVHARWIQGHFIWPFILTLSSWIEAGLNKLLLIWAELQMSPYNGSCRWTLQLRLIYAQPKWAGPCTCNLPAGESKTNDAGEDPASCVRVTHKIAHEIHLSLILIHFVLERAMNRVKFYFTHCGTKRGMRISFAPFLYKMT